MENKLILISLSEAELKSLINDAVANALEHVPPNVEIKKQVVDLEGLLKERPFIGSRSTIYKKASSGLIPHYKNGKKLYFDLQEIDKWLLSNKVKTEAERQQEAQKIMNRKRK